MPPQGTSLPPAMSSTRHQPRVLIVEDDDAFRTLLARKLHRKNLDVVEAASVEDAFDAVAETAPGQSARPFDVVISDLRLPGMTGFHLLTTLRKYDATLRIILITAFGDAATHREAGRLGAVAVFNKPFDLDELTAAVLQEQTPLILAAGALLSR
jgi:DNA-binding response OmpR family regulator